MPPPRLSLVIDNSSVSSSRTPSALAKRLNGSCQRYGIAPRQRHVATVLGRAPSFSASAAGPPKRVIKSSGLHIETRDITFCNMAQTTFCDDDLLIPSLQTAPMARLSSQDKAMGQLTIDRVKWLESQTDEQRGDFARRMGLTYGAYKNALERGSFRTVNLIKLAVSLDVSLDFICGLTDDLRSVAPRRQQKTFWEIQKPIEKTGSKVA